MDEVEKSGTLWADMDTPNAYLLRFQRYLETEERRSVGTVRGYLADVRQLMVFLNEHSVEKPFS